MMHRAMRICGAFLAVAILSIFTAEAQTACSVNYTITNQWPGGFGTSITINNTGTTAINAWTLGWSFANGQTITQLWDGNVTQSGANVTVTNMSYNGNIAVGGSLTGLGFNGTWNNVTNAIPTSFTVNGVVCGATSNFSLTPSSASLTLAPGASASDTISIVDLGSFSGNVTLAATGLPSGVTASFATNPATSSSVLTLTATSTATTGTSNITITGTSGTLTQSTTIAITVQAASTGSFTLTPSASALTLNVGSSTTDTVTVAASGGFTGNVTLAASGLPNGVTAAFSTNPTTSTSIVTFTASSAATAATSTVAITGTSGSLSASTNLSLTVAPASSTSNVAVNVNVLANRHTISPYIYGGAYPQSAANVTDDGLSLVRWGGNATSTYNWQLHTYNSGNDWYYEDFTSQGFSNGTDSDSVQFVTDVINAGSHPLTTMPMLDWVAQSPENGTNGHWSYSVSTYGAQCGSDPYNKDAGDGLKSDCSTPVTSNAITTAYFPLLDDTTESCSGASCVYRNAWAEALSTAFGSNTCAVPYSNITSCHFYDMDNEMDIWGGSHRDVHPAASGYDELANIYQAEATKLKTWDN